MVIQLQFNSNQLQLRKLTPSIDYFYKLVYMHIQKVGVVTWAVWLLRLNQVLAIVTFSLRLIKDNKEIATSTFFKMEDDLDFIQNERQPQFFENGRQSKKNQHSTAPGNLVCSIIIGLTLCLVQLHCRSGLLGGPHYSLFPAGKVIQEKIDYTFHPEMILTRQSFKMCYLLYIGLQ